MAHTACLVCFISPVNGHCNKKKKRKEEAYPSKAGASSGHTTNLKQSILRLFSISMVTINEKQWDNRFVPQPGKVLSVYYFRIKKKFLNWGKMTLKGFCDVDEKLCLNAPIVLIKISSCLTEMK